jgi:hypothetical protein
METVRQDSLSETDSEFANQVEAPPVRRANGKYLFQNKQANNERIPNLYFMLCTLYSACLCKLSSKNPIDIVQGQ